MMNAELAHWAKDEFTLDKTPDNSTISKALKREREADKDTKVVTGGKKRQRPGVFPVSSRFDEVDVNDIDRPSVHRESKTLSHCRFRMPRKTTFPSIGK